jgi:hypothetical protein
VHADVAVKERQDGPEYQKHDCFVCCTIPLIEVLVMTNELHLGRWYTSCHCYSYGTVILLTVFRFCIETEYARVSTPLSCVPLWVLYNVCMYVRVRKWGCGSRSSLTSNYG